MTIYKFKAYREFIRHRIEENSQIRGYQGRLADIAKCQKSYFSNVLSGKVNLNQEQAMRLALFWQLPPGECDYFLELVNLDRAEFVPLKKRILERLKKMRGDGENLAKRFSKSSAVTNASEALYYSSWIWSALHILVGISNYQTETAISQRLNIPLPTVRSHLAKLLEMGLVRCKGQKWGIKPGHFHLPKESAFNSLNHMNWRQRAVLDSQFPTSDGLHYTCVQSHSQEDFLKIKELLLDFLDSNRATIEDSENEELACVCVDFFRVS